MNEEGLGACAAGKAARKKKKKKAPQHPLRRATIGAGNRKDPRPMSLKSSKSERARGQRASIVKVPVRKGELPGDIVFKRGIRTKKADQKNCPAEKPY